MTIDSIDIEATHLISAYTRLGWAAETVENRIAEMAQEKIDRLADDSALPAARWPGPANEIHMYGDPAVLLDDAECLAYLTYIARHGEQGGFVVLWHGDLDMITEAFRGKGTVLSAALVAGRVFRHALPPMRPEPAQLEAVLRTEPTTEAQGQEYSERLAVEVWAALVLGDAQQLTLIFDSVRMAANESDRSWQLRRFMSSALRRAADAVLPGAGGTILGQRMCCPLCDGEPMFLPVDMPGHLLEVHRPADSVAAVVVGEAA